MSDASFSLFPRDITVHVPQELLIQQLQEELSSLRNRANQLDIARQGKGDYFAFPGDVGGGTSVSEWKGKLVRAAKHIAQLVREKQQLTELSNRLQAELKQAGKSCIAQSSGRGLDWK